MDELENLICEFHKKKITHPNLSNLWIHYLSRKQEKIHIHSEYLFKNTIEQATKVLLYIQNEDYIDISRENIVILYCLAHQFSYNNT